MAIWSFLKQVDQEMCSTLHHELPIIIQLGSNNQYDITSSVNKLDCFIQNKLFKAFLP